MYGIKYITKFNYKYSYNGKSIWVWRHEYNTANNTFFTSAVISLINLNK